MLMWLGIIFFIVGLSVLVFRKKIGRLYDKMTYLSESQKNHYKNVILRVLGTILLLIGILFAFIEILDSRNKELVFQFIKNNFYVFEIIIGSILILLAMIITVIRIINKVEHLSKLGPMKKLYGPIKGSIIHIIGYIIIPFVFGIYLLISGLKKII